MFIVGSIQINIYLNLGYFFLSVFMCDFDSFGIDSSLIKIRIYT